jgi:hypothetical protein
MMRSLFLCISIGSIPINCMLKDDLRIFDIECQLVPEHFASKLQSPYPHSACCTFSVLWHDLQNLVCVAISTVSGCLLVHPTPCLRPVISEPSATQAEGF